MTWLNHLTRNLWRGTGTATPFQRQRIAYHNATQLVAIFYTFNLAFAFYRASCWQASDYNIGSAAVWPVAWCSKLPSAGRILLLLYVAAAFLACIIPQNRWARLFSSICLFFHIAYINSFGAIGHNGHVLLWTSILFVFLPAPKHQNTATRAFRQRYLFQFWTAQFTCLLFYTMSGGLKIVGMAYQFYIGEITALHPTALARHIAGTQFMTNGTSMLGDYFVQYPLLGWPMFVFAICLEFGSVFIAFRPNLHRAWGIALLAMHTGIGLTLDIWFTTHFFVIGLLLVNSPFGNSETCLSISSENPAIH